MRIGAGILKGRALELPKGSRARPATSFVAEMAMNLFTPWRLEGGVFLDVCAGSGLIGFEAISRGAPAAIFVEVDEAHAEAISAAARRFGVFDRCKVMRRDARRCISKVREALGEFESRGLPGKIACTFLDPPYIPGMAQDVLQSFCASALSAGTGKLFIDDAMLVLRTPDRIVTEWPGFTFVEAREASRAKLWLFKPQVIEESG